MNRLEQHTSDGSELSPFVSFWFPLIALTWLSFFWWLFFTSDLPNLSSFMPDRLALLSHLLFADSPADPNSSFSSLIERIPILLYALSMVISACCCGRFVLRRLKLLQNLERSAALALSGGLGLSIVSLFTLTVGWFGLLNRILFIVALTLPVVVESIESIRDRRHLRNELKTARRDGSSKWVIFSLMICIPFLAVMLLGAMLPSTDFDVKEYHLQGPKEFFLSGRVAFLPHNVYTSFPFLTEMLSLCGMVLAKDWWSGALMGKTVLCSFAVFTGCGVYAVAKRVAGSNAGWLAVVCYLTTPWVFRISTIAYTEGAACCYVILTFLAFVLWRERVLSKEVTSTAQFSAATLVGLLAGNSIATKYPGLVLVTIPVAFAMTVILVLNANQRDTLLRQLMAFGIGVCITFGPWMLKNTVETGNPVYPLAYSIFGGRDWDADLNEKWKKAHGRPTPPFKEPRAMLSDFTGNLRDVTFRHDWLSPLLYGLAPFALVLAFRKRETWLLVAVGLWILGAWYTLTHLLDRFWVPVLPIVAALAGVGGAQLLVLLSPRSLRNSSPLLRFIQRITALSFFALLIGSVVFNFAMITARAGFVGNSAFLMPYEISRDAVKPDAIQIAEAVMKSGDRILFVGEAQVFDAEFDLLYNTVFDDSLLELLTAQPLETATRQDESQAWELLSEEEIQQNFEVAGVTHILVNWREILRYRTTYGYTNFVSPQRIAELAHVWPFEEVKLNPLGATSEWDVLDESWQAEIDRWGPELKIIRSDGTVMIKEYQLFAVPRSGITTQ